MRARPIAKLAATPMPLERAMRVPKGYIHDGLYPREREALAGRQIRLTVGGEEYRGFVMGRDPEHAGYYVVRLDNDVVVQWRPGTDECEAESDETQETI